MHAPYRKSAAPPPTPPPRRRGALDGILLKFLGPPLLAAPVLAIAGAVGHPVAFTVALFVVAGIGAHSVVQMMVVAGEAVMEPVRPPFGVPRVVSGFLVWAALSTSQVFIGTAAALAPLVVMGQWP